MLCNQNFGKIIALYFYAEWNEESVELKDLILEYLQSYDMNCIFGLVCSDKEEVTFLCEEYKIESVPSCLLIDSDKNVLNTFDSINPGEIFQKIEEQNIQFMHNFELEKVKMFNKIDHLLKQHPVVVFIKGTQKNPECGFSRQILEFFDNKNVIYQDTNVFTEGYRHWIKEYSSYQNIPQVYIEGKFVGGLDNVKSFDAEGKLDAMIPKGSIRSNPSELLDKILTDSRMILFKTSGKENNEWWKWSMNAQKLLGEQAMLQSMFDTKDFPEIQNELLKRSEKAEMPQLYLDGKIWATGEEMLTKLAPNSNDNRLFDDNLYMKNINDHLKMLINKSNVMVFIKGSPDAPQCGFSNKICQTLDKLKVDYGHFNILQDPLVREKLKVYSDWNTYPQVYVDGDLVGGLDIVNELIEAGDFQDMVASYLKA